GVGEPQRPHRPLPPRARGPLRRRRRPGAGVPRQARARDVRAGGARARPAHRRVRGRRGRRRRRRGGGGRRHGRRRGGLRRHARGGPPRRPRRFLAHAREAARGPRPRVPALSPPAPPEAGGVPRRVSLGWASHVSPGHEYFHLQLSDGCNILAIMAPPASSNSASEREAALQLLASIQRARRALIAYGERCADRLGLTFPELLVLNELVHTAHPTVVSRSTGIPPSTISRLLRSLEDRGL